MKSLTQFELTLVHGAAIVFRSYLADTGYSAGVSLVGSAPYNVVVRCGGAASSVVLASSSVLQYYVCCLGQPINIEVENGYASSVSFMKCLPGNQGSECQSIPLV